MGDNPGESDLESEILGRNNRVKTIAYCNAAGEQEQIGPHFIEVFPPTTQGGVGYVHGQILDGRFGHYSLKDGSRAFGGPTKEISDKFEDIDGNPYKRVKEDDERVSLKDVRGGRYTGVAHDTIERDHSTPLEDQGVVYRVTDDEEEGYFLNEKLCGRHNAMAHKSKLVQTEDGVYLVQTNAEGNMRVVDIYTGDIVFADEEKCTGIKFVMVGDELCALKSYKDSKQWLRPKDGKVIYEGLPVRVGTWFKCSAKGMIVRTYDKDGFLVPVERSGRPCFTKVPVPLEAEDGPEGDGRHTIDRKPYMKFFLLKQDPCDENDNTEVTYRGVNGNDAFGCPHDEEVESKKNRPNRVKVHGKTGILFKNRASKRMFWKDANGRPMFGGDHWDDLKTIEGWQHDAEGRRTEQELTLKHLEDVGLGAVVRDYQAHPYFQNNDSKTPDYHKEIRNFWVLSYNRDGEDFHALVLEAGDPVGIIRSIGGFFSGKGFKPSTYYLMDGTKFNSVNALKDAFEVPKANQLINIDKFDKVRVTTHRPRDTQEIPAIDLEGDRSVGAMIERGELGGAEKTRELEATIEAANAALSASRRGEPAEGKTEIGAELLPDEEQAADAGVVEEPAPAEEVTAAVEEAPEPEQESDAGTEKAPDKPLSSWLLGDDGDPGTEKASSEEASEQGDSSNGKGKTASWLDATAEEGGTEQEG